MLTYAEWNYLFHHIIALTSLEDPFPCDLGTYVALIPLAELHGHPATFSCTFGAN